MTMTRNEAETAARNFLRNRDRLGKWQTSDLLANLGRSHEFPAGTPAFTGALTVSAISAFIQAHAVEID
jgi:hypothetical protein